MIGRFGVPFSAFSEEAAADVIVVGGCRTGHHVVTTMALLARGQEYQQTIAVLLLAG